MIRTRNLRGIIGETFNVYRERFWPMVGIVAVVQVPLAILGLVFGLWAIGMYEEIGTAVSPFIYAMVSGEAVSMPYDVVASLVVLFLVGLAFAGIAWVSNTAIYGAVAHAAAQRYERSQVSISQSYEVVWHRIWSLLGATILGALAILGMVITVIGIPFAIYFGVRWTLAYQAVVLEGVGARSALSRSSFLVRGSWWRVAGIEGVLGGIAGILSSVSGGLGGLILDIGFSQTLLRWGASEIVSEQLSSLASSLVGMLFIPITMIGVTILYFDLRAREERTTAG